MKTFVLLAGIAAVRIAFASAATLALGSCALIYPDDPSNLSVGTVIDDKSTALLAQKQIEESSPELEAAHIVVTSYDGVVLIAGQVSSEAQKTAAADAIKNVRTIKRIHNELELAGATSYLARANDGTLTTSVKARLVADNNVHADHIKVVTENGVVYLMGLVSRSESEAAVEVARNVYGVQRVVTLFEYLPSG